MVESGLQRQKNANVNTLVSHVHKNSHYSGAFLSLGREQWRDFSIADLYISTVMYLWQSCATLTFWEGK